MKAIITAIIAAGILVPTSAVAQQTNYYQVCKTYQENYVPGYYDQYGNYIPGYVNTNRYNTSCGVGGGGPVTYQQPTYNRRICNPAAGAAMGAGLASALSGGSGWQNSGSWNRKYNRNSSSGSWSNSYKNTSGWTLFGAGLGALMYSC